MYLDAGTNNEQYLHDPLYLGLRQARPSTADLYAFVDEFVEAVHMFDVHGLLESTRTDLSDFQLPYAHPHAPTTDFVAAIKSLEPTTIIGVSTLGGAFTRQVVEAMAQINERPVILALSNPTGACGMHGRASVHLVKGPGDLRGRGPIFARPPSRARPSCQDKRTISTFFGGGHGHLCYAGQACERQDVHRGGRRSGGSSARCAAEAGAPLSAAGEHSRNRDQDRGPGRSARI
jgi:hypothetical protein